jgi:hypothetical protein
MPYQRNGKRNYKKEYALYHSTPEQRANRSERTVARNQANADGRTSKGDGKDLDHRVPLSKGGSSAKSNLRPVSRSENRSFSRNKDGSLKSQTSKREKKK